MLIAVLLVLQGSTVLQAQNRINSVRVSTKPNGVIFFVDGQEFRSPTNFLWPAGSKHHLSAQPIQDTAVGGIRPGTKYELTGWSTNLGPVSSVWPITADPNLTYVEGTFAVSYLVRLRYYNGPSAQSPGRIYLNGEHTRDADMYLPAGSTVKVEAYPNPGYVFAGWMGLPDSGPKTAFIQSFVVNQPVTVGPIFRLARPVHVNVETSPPGLKVLLDRTPMPAPASLEWEVTSEHTLGVMPEQVDENGKLWIFDSWSDSGAMNHSITMPIGVSELKVTARFVPGTAVSFLTDPPQLNLTIDGRSNWQNYTFRWAAGTKHRISAPLEQKDAMGRRFKFREWSNGGAATQEFTVENTPDNVHVTALYEPIGEIKVSSSPAGLRIMVNGQECSTPCALDRNIGTEVQVSVPETAERGDGGRLVFQSWSDGASRERKLVAVSPAQAVVANFRLQYRLTAAALPAEGARVNLDPGSTDGYYDAESQVVASIESKPGFRFLGWDGDWTGKSRTAVLSMTAPKAIRAQLEPVPHILPSGVRNAAGETPESGIRPGSVFSIYGVNLAPQSEIGPPNPLAQTLAGVMVRIGQRLLPLLFVSPEQINAQLPWDLNEGTHTLAVRWEGKPEVAATFDVVRYAPGLFVAQTIDSQSFGLFAHENGASITPASPARMGEVVTLFGTGSGPYKRTPPEGFILPEIVDFQLADPVELVCNGIPFQPLYAGTAARAVGIDAIRFRVDEHFPQAGTCDLKLRVNGHESNTVLLPVE